MKKPFHLILVFLSLWVIWQNSPTLALADGPNAALPEETIPQHLVIPSIVLDSSIVPVGVGKIEIEGQTYPIWETAENDIGWHQGSGPPGQAGNTVLAGHSNGGREIFRHLADVEIGADIFVATNNGWYHYRVTDKLILREQGASLSVRTANAQWILPTTDERLTLVTCWPYPTSTHRLLVIAHPIPNPSPSLTSTPNLDFAPEQPPALEFPPPHISPSSSTQSRFSPPHKPTTSRLKLSFKAILSNYRLN
jgi:LPXTG-site transpeptidase (sortase) family protein